MTPQAFTGGEVPGKGLGASEGRRRQARDSGKAEVGRSPTREMAPLSHFV